MDTGGLAQMTYNQFSPTGLGLPGAGFASRGKASGLKRLSVASPPSIASISEDGVEPTHTPRTSRSHLLAGLRTQPKTPGHPASAPYSTTQHRLGLDASKRSGQSGNAYGQNVPHTAIGANFPNSAQQYSVSAGQQVYALPEQVLAPPTIDYADMQGDDVDPNVMSQLMATELFLAQRQQQLQQQLFHLTAGLQGMNMNGVRSGGQTPHTPMTPQMSFYSQQLQNGVSPIPQEIPGQPGVYLVYNPMTGQHTVAVDPSMHQQQAQLAHSPPPATPGSAYAAKPAVFNPDTPTFQVSPPIETSRTGNPFDSSSSRSISPPKKSPSPPTDVTPLPPPSANAFRRGHHKKVSSLAFDSNSSTPVADGPKSAFTRPVGFPATPMTGTFGPGNARAGEHPVRQPRGPPPMEELVAAPTSRHEGSRNFASRQRRKAVSSLVRAGIERRGVSTSSASASGRQSSVDSIGSGGSVLQTPASETTELVFGVPSDGEGDSSVTSSASGSGSLSGSPSYGSLKSAAAIGSEMQAERQRKAGSRSSSSASSVDGSGVEEFKMLAGSRRGSPMGLAVGGGFASVGIKRAF